MVVSTVSIFFLAASEPPLARALPPFQPVLALEEHVHLADVTCDDFPARNDNQREASWINLGD